MVKSIIIGALAMMVGMGAASVVAQPQFNPLEDFFRRMDRNNPNPDLNCDTYKRLNRQGEIIWLRLECTANRNYGRGR